MHSQVSHSMLVVVCTLYNEEPHEKPAYPAPSSFARRKTFRISFHFPTRQHLLTKSDSLPLPIFYQEKASSKTSISVF